MGVILRGLPNKNNSEEIETGKNIKDMLYMEIHTERLTQGLTLDGDHLFSSWQPRPEIIT